MSIELMLLLLFAGYHLGFAGGLSFLFILCMRLFGCQPSPSAGHNLWLAIFSIAVIAPIALVSWHGQSLNQSSAPFYESEFSPESYSLRQHSASEQEPALAPQSLSDHRLLGKGGGAPNISNTENPFYYFDQLAHVSSPLIQLLLLLIIVGVVICILRTLWMLAATVWLVKSAVRWRPSAAIKQSIKVKVLQSGKITTPMATGIFSPVILLPAGLAENLSEQQLLAVLFHEQAHIQRQDLRVSLAIKLLTTLLWWSAPLHFIDSQIRRYREMVCDERAAVGVGGKVQYAQSLLDCARLLVTRRSVFIGVELTPHKNELGYRITQLLSDYQPRKTATAAMLTFGVMLCVISFHTSQALNSVIHNEELIRLARQYQLQSPEEGRRLVKAITTNDSLALARLVKSGVNINLPIELKGTPLMVAVGEGNVAMVSSLLSLGADPNQAADRRGNPLIFAATIGDQEIAEALLKAGADINAVVPRDETPLMNAARSGQLSMVQYLVEQGARVSLGVRTGVHDQLEYRTAMSLASTREIQEYLTLMGAKEGVKS